MSSEKSSRQGKKAKTPQSKNSPSSPLPESRAASAQATARRPVTIALVVLFSIGAGAGLFLWINSPKVGRTISDQAYVPRPQETIDFCEEIAPIIFKNCSGCHRPGQSAPFNLLTYADVKKRAKQIAEVTSRRYMPPWLPESGYGDFADERRLTTDELGIIQQWVAEDAIEGDRSKLPAMPNWIEGWQLGKPDLVVRLPEPYTLPAEGRDVYRNFVVPIPVSGLRFVKGVEFLPGNPKVVHHAFINIDETGQSRRIAARQNPPGFDGMELPDSAMMPGGQLLGWQPGKTPYFVGDGLSWVLKPKTDLVLQLHMNPSGKPELVQPTVAFYFTDQAPTNTPFRIKLANFEIDIPPGASDRAFENSYVLPVDITLVRVSAHAHYLGKDLQGYAILPGGEKKWLLRIPDWNFFWQGDYKYAEPVALPKGTKLVMHYTYDNSTNNVRNPNRPPKHVRYGLQSSDEMAELYFQAVARDTREREILAKDYFGNFLLLSMSYYKHLLRIDPHDARAHARLGRAYIARGQTADAISHLTEAIRIKPDDDLAHFDLGYLHLVQNRFPDAYREFATVTRLNPNDYQAFGNLGYICLKSGRRDEAKSFFEAALRINPDDETARKNLGLLKSAR